MPSARLLVLVLLLCLATPLTAQPPSSGQQEPPAQAMPQLFATGLIPATSVAFDHQGNAYLANYRRPGVVGRITPEGAAGILCDLAEAVPLENHAPRISCLRVDVEGRIIVADAGGGRLLRVAQDGGRVEVLADRHDGERFTAVEAVGLDRLGDIYFTDRGGPAEEDLETESELEPPAEEESTAVPATGALYRFDIQTGKVTLLDQDLAAPAGVAVSPDQSQLVLSQAATGELLVYQLSPQGEVSQRGVLLSWEDTTAPAEPAEESPAKPPIAAPSGLAFAADGLLYVVLAGRGEIEAIDLATGETKTTYAAGGTGARDCHFHAGDLYIAVAPKEAVFRLPLATEGYDYCGQ